jgi:hypothetical protein
VLFRRFPHPSLCARACLLGGLAALALAPALRAADAAEEPPPAFSDKTSEALTKIQPLLEAKDWDGTLALINGALAAAGPDSYDRAFLIDLAAKLAIQKDDSLRAITCWEEALRLADAHPNYFRPKDRLDLILSLAQTYSQLASGTKNPTVARDDFNKAADYIRRWLAATPKPTFEAEYFYATVLYSQATANEKRVDTNLLHQAEEATQKALHMQVRPPERLYLLLEAIYSAEGDMARGSQILELLVRQDPQKDYWLQLWQTYTNLAGQAEKDEDLSRRYTVRAINTEERAQAYGKMKSNKDNFNLVTMYFSVNEYGKATDLLSAGLKSRHIDSTKKNWQVLSYAYQQVNEPQKAIQALLDAEADFPSEGDLDLDIAQVYSQSLDDSANAYKYALAAVTKGNLEKPYNAYQFLAYEAYEQEKFPEAMDAVTKAEALTPGKVTVQLTNLKKLIQQSLTMQQNAAAPAPTSKQ